MTAIAFIGLGNMGAPMAENLLNAGHIVHVHDISADAIAKLVARGAHPATSAVDAASRAQIVITMLPTGAVVADLYFGPNGLLASLTNRPLLIDSSTIAADTARKLEAAAQAAGFAMLDAPVSGGVMGAREGTLAFIVGGSRDAFEQAEPILRAMGRSIIHAGESGAGQVAKICNNMLAAILMAGTAEALALGARNGLDPKSLSAIIEKSSGGNFMVERWNPWPGVLPDSPASKGYAGGFQVALMLKDLELALHSAQTSKAAVPLGALARNLFQLHAAAGDDIALRDMSSIQSFYYPQLPTEIPASATKALLKRAC
ncbi:MAG TPA: 3-hydroxyisobutyrate dehydrogenase [Sphingobium sp.]